MSGQSLATLAFAAPFLGLAIVFAFGLLAIDIYDAHQRNKLAWRRIEAARARQHERRMASLSTTLARLERRNAA